MMFCMVSKISSRDLNWQTRLALEWLISDPEKEEYWRFIASANDPAAVAHELTRTMVQEISALPPSFARDAAMISLQEVEWRKLALTLRARPNI